MPGGISFNETQSYVVYAVIKTVGYCGAGLYFKAKYPNSKYNFLLIGIVRTLIGMSFGAVAGLLANVNAGIFFGLFLLGLIPLRYFEWWITFRLFLLNPKDSKVDHQKLIGEGIVWSFILDVPAICGFLASGGLWIC